MKLLHNFKFLAISYTEFCDRLSYYGLQSLLVLYLVNSFHLSLDASYATYGQYSALTFGLCVIGGIIADKWLSQFESVLYGVIFMLIANVILFISTQLHWVYIAMAFLIVGVGLIKPVTSCMVGDLYKESPALSDKAFTWFYTIGSSGSILGPILYGFSLVMHDYRIGFVFSSIVILINVFILLAVKRTTKSTLAPTDQYSNMKSIFILFCMLIATYLVISGEIPIMVLFIPALLLCMVYLLQMITKLTEHEREKTALIIVPMICSIIFFSVYLQLYASIIIFIHNDVKTMLFGWSIPATWFSSLEPVFLLIITPIIAWMHQFFIKDGQSFHYLTKKMLMGLIATAIGFMFFSISAYSHHLIGEYALILLVLANLFLAIGELCVIPVSIQIISMYAAKKYRGLLMGCYYFSLALSGYFSGILAKLAPVSIEQKFGHFFLIIAVSLVLFVFMLWCSFKYLEKFKYNICDN